MINDNKAVCVIGDVILDKHVRGVVRRISQEAPVPILEYIEEETSLGGAANVAVNINTMGGRARLMGVVGTDIEAGILELLLRGKHGNHHIRHVLLQNERRRTTVKTRYTDTEGRQLLRVDRDMQTARTETREILAALVREPLIDGAGCLVLSDYGKGALSFEVICCLIDDARKHKVPVFVDTKNPDAGIWRGAELIKPNLETALSMWKLSTKTPLPSDFMSDRAMMQIAKHLSHCFLADFVITRGPRGMVVCKRNGEACVIEGQQAQVYDVTGAGDTVMACLAAGVASGMDLFDAARWANTAGSLAVRKSGTAQITKAELLEEVVGATAASKSVSEDAAVAIVEAWKTDGHPVVFTNGCFDLLHYGHWHLLEEAKKQGHKLVVAVNTDASVKALKGPDRPVISFGERCTALSKLDSVDLLVTLDEGDPERLIHRLKPDILVKGSDWRGKQVAGADYVSRRGGRVHFVEAIPGISTTILTQIPCQTS